MKLNGVTHREVKKEFSPNYFWDLVKNLAIKNFKKVIVTKCESIPKNPLSTQDFKIRLTNC